MKKKVLFHFPFWTKYIIKFLRLAIHYHFSIKENTYGAINIHFSNHAPKSSSHKTDKSRNVKEQHE